MKTANLGAVATVLLFAACSAPALFAQDTSSAPSAAASSDAAASSSEASTPEAAGEPAPRTTWDGVFTEAQAERGHEVYNQKCATCHNGGMHGPGLNTGSFRKKWDSVTLDGLYYFTRDNMPAGNGRSLSDQQYIDVISYLLQRNKMPAGDVELPPDETALGYVTFLAKQP